MSQEETPPAVPCPVGECPGTLAVRVLGDFKAFGCDGPDRHGDASVRGAWSSQDRFAESRAEQDTDGLLKRIDPTAWVLDKLAEAQRLPEHHFEWEDIESVGELPKFPTGFTRGETARLPSLNGMVTLSGKASAGKSWFALGSSLRAASEGWDVHYVAAEGEDVIKRRIMQSNAPRKGFNLHSVQPGVTPDIMIKNIAEWVHTPKTLLVIDSISTLLGLMSLNPDASRWENQADLEIFLMRIRGLTKGAVSLLILSEANAAGETKGRSLDHKSDVAINFLSAEEDPEVKIIKVVKSWEGHTGTLGFGRVDWQSPGMGISQVPPTPPVAEPSTGDHW